MSIERAERLKRELTDKWVVVAESVPELKRFAKFTGKVRTVNMNGRALVEFDGPADIGWYDIDPSFLTVVDGPRPVAKPDAHVAKPAASAAPAAKPKTAAASTGSPLDKIRAGASAAAKPAGGSPLDKIRAAGAGAATAPAQSPLDKIRAAGASAKPPATEATATDTAAESGKSSSESTVPSSGESPAPSKPTTAAAPTGGSPLDRIRSMGAAKKE